MLTIGVDAHKRVHQALALDHAGTILAPGAARIRPIVGSCSSPGPSRCLVHGTGASKVRGITGLAQFLIAHGETVYEVNPRWTAERQRRARKPGKSDRLDAHAVAKLVRDEAATLPNVIADDETAVLDLLVTEREAALAEATRIRNQVHHLLLQVDPEYQGHLPSLTSTAGLRAGATYQCTSINVLDQQRTAAIRRLAQRLRLVVEQAAALEHEIAAVAAPRYQPLTHL